MYSSCLFCNGSLGRNEAIERFPVGRRLAFDAAKGRLWVICPSCARWNLSPLEVRWEAIDDMERAYRDTRMRASTGQIGLARLKDGTELVRIGQPLLPEFAAWRYGRMFSKRYWRANTIEFQGTVLTSLQLGVQLSPLHTSGIAIAGAYAAMYGWFAFQFARSHRRKHVPTLTIRDGEGALRRLSVADAGSAELTNRDDEGLSLALRCREARPTGALLSALGRKHRYAPSRIELELNGDAARRALATMLPAINVWGGDSKTVASAVSVVSEQRSLKDTFLAREDREGRSLLKLPRLVLAGLPAGYRLALEMKLHEEDERRALEGELHELEARWREAEEIAAIADGLFVPESVERSLRNMRAAQATEDSQ